MHATGPALAGQVLSRTRISDEAADRFESLPSLGWAAFKFLLDRGVPAPAIVWPELPASTRVVFHGAQPLFDFEEEVEEDGVPALLFLACDGDGRPCDIVAWSHSLQRVAAYFGATGVLGADDILWFRLTDENALPVHRSPLEWLRADRFGVVIIDPAHAYVALRDFGPFAAQDEAHGRELRKLFRSREPKIFVPNMFAEGQAA
jgi:hypothetical protein